MNLLKDKLIHYLRKKRIRISLGIALTFLLTLSAAGYFVVPGVLVLERQLYDFKVAISAKEKVAKSSNVVILDIDEKSLSEFGRWPWSHSLIAKINDKLFDRYKISALGYDIIFAEPDNVNTKAVLEKLNLALIEKSPNYSEFIEGIGRLDPDRLFLESLDERAVVLGVYFNNNANALLTNDLPAPVLTTKELPASTNSIIPWKTFTGNLPEFTKAAMSGAHFNSIVDEDGVTRRIPLILRYNNDYYQSLSLGLVRASLGNMPVAPIIYGDKGSNYFRLEAFNLGPINIPVASDGTVLIPYHGKDHSFSYISVSDLLNDKVSSDVLEGKIVIMGSSSPGLRDQRATPLHNVFPGVEIHANLIDGILDNEIKHAPPYAEAAVIIQVFAAGLLLAIFLPALGATYSILMVIAMIAIGVLFNYALWSQFNLVMPIAEPLIIVLLIFVMDMAVGYLIEGRLQKNMSTLFGQYVPPELVTIMADDPLKYSMEGKDADLTILFSDIRGFTGIAEKLTASQLTTYINEYFSLMSLIINKEMGTLDKYIGDAVMAFWGAPLENNRHPYFAVKAALKMSLEADLLAKSFEDRGLPKFNIGIGLSSGLVRVGDMGSIYRRSYTVMGDSVNLASRLEGLTKIYGLRVLVSEDLKNRATEFAYQEIDRVKVKGREMVTTIYAPIGPHGDLTATQVQELDLWSRVLPLYYEGDWNEFALALNSLIKTFGERKFYSLYLERVESFKKNPPPKNWQGVHVIIDK